MTVYVVLTGIFGNFWCEDVSIERVCKHKETAENVAAEKRKTHGLDAIVEEWEIDETVTVKPKKARTEAATR